MTSRVDRSTSNKLPKDMQQLSAIIAALPEEHRSQVEPLFQQVADSTRRRQRILSLVQEALSQLRLDMKYLLFDLEATRRERDEYRDALEQNNNNNDNDNDNDTD